MIYNYPYFGLPNYNNFINHYNLPPYSNNIINSKKKKINSNNYENKYQKKQSNSVDCFEILGIKLKFDDILIICILLFLFNEKNNDTYLTLSLIMLLLS